MRSGKTHSTLLEIEEREEKQTPGLGREEQVQPIWHMELEKRNIYTDPNHCRAFSLWSFFSYLSVSVCLSLVFTSLSLLYPIILYSLFFPNPHIFILVFILISFFCRSLSLFLSHFLCLFCQANSWVPWWVVCALRCSQTWAFAARVFAARTERVLRRTSASCRDLQYSRFTILHTLLHTLLHSFTSKHKSEKCRISLHIVSSLVLSGHYCMAPRYQL